MKNAINQKEIYYKCAHCGDEIFWNTHKKLTFCRCNKIAVDGCEYYIRLIGNSEDYKMIKAGGKGKATAYIANQ